MEKPDLLGNVYGDLFVVGKTSPLEDARTKWKCLCSCGGERDVTTKQLIDGTTTACRYHTKKIPEARPLKDAKSIGALISHKHFIGMVQGLSLTDPIAARMASFIKPWSLKIQDEQIVIQCNWIGPEEEREYGVVALEKIHQALDANRSEIVGKRRIRIHCPIEGAIPLFMEVEALRRQIDELGDRMDAVTEQLSVR